jgi:hypothetical protein
VCEEKSKSIIPLLKQEQNFSCQSSQLSINIIEKQNILEHSILKENLKLSDEDTNMDNTFILRDININNQFKSVFIQFDLPLIFVKLVMGIVMLRIFLALEKIE